MKRLELFEISFNNLLERLRAKDNARTFIDSSIDPAMSEFLQTPLKHFSEKKSVDSFCNGLALVEIEFQKNAAERNRAIPRQRQGLSFSFPALLL